jgi:hypothetical protein
MGVAQADLNRAYATYGPTYGGRKEDYFAVLFLAKEFQREIEDVAQQVAFGGNDYGIDAFFIDGERRNLYLYQFKWSENHSLFKESFKRLISAGIERVFGNPHMDQTQNQFLLQLRTALNENQALVDRILIHFVFNGDTERAEQSAVLDSLREDLESKKFVMDGFFAPRQVTLTIQFVSNQTRRIGGVVHSRRTHEYRVSLEESIEHRENGKKLIVGLVPLHELYGMFREMGPRFFERNIRFGLDPDRAPNRAIRQALTKIILREEEPPEVFAFNHNGVTLAAEGTKETEGGDGLILIEPRLLNGAQTIASLHKFLEENERNPSLKRNAKRLNSIKVLAKVITDAPDSFVVKVTVCNNKQNPVEPWNLRASDELQLELQDKFREELGAYYERQEKAFENMSYEDLEEMGIEQYRAIQMKRLAQTFLAIQGEIDKISRLAEVFESETGYRSAFKSGYLRTDAKLILLLYKVQSRLNRVIREIVDRGTKKYWFISRARNLVWSLLIHGLLNHERLPRLVERFGTQLVVEADFTDELRSLAPKIRLIIGDAIKDNRYEQLLEEERYSFLRTRAFFDRCMDFAHRRYRWRKQTI